jgi:hypothetical protein
MSNPESLLSYGRAHGAAGAFFDSEQDLGRRPHLSALLEDPPPAGYRLVILKPRPEGGEVRLFTFAADPETVEDTPARPRVRGAEGSLAHAGTAP